MESSKTEKRVMTDDAELRMVEPILVRLNKHGPAPHDIHIDKSEFKIGRARDNDEIILDTVISRRHCILRSEGNEEWTIKDLSSTSTFINDVPLTHGTSRRIYVGDIIQFSESNEFKYVFTLSLKEEHGTKRPKMDEQIFDSVLIEQKTFAENQACQRKVLKDQIQTKQKEQIELKEQLERLLQQQTIARDDKEDLERQISVLGGRIEAGNAQEQHLQNMYSDLLKKLETERVQFEARLNEERQKWQEALDLSKQEKDLLEVKMKEQMEKWREQQQTEWRSVMENRVKEEKDIQAQLLNEKTKLEEKLKETEKALKEQEAKAETKQNNAIGSAEDCTESCILLEYLGVNDTSGIRILDTIDLTEATQATEASTDSNTKEGVLDKVTGIMDEQLTCSICSELFVNATTLSCMHTFCQHCINSWNKKRKQCPVCRAPVVSMNRSLVLDNFIESMLENLPTNLKDRRKEVIQERKKEVGQAKKLLEKKTKKR